MEARILVVDFPLKGKEKSSFVRNGAEGQVGLVSIVEENGFKPELIRYDSPKFMDLYPGDHAAIVFASGWTEIRDHTDGPDSRELNPAYQYTRYPDIPSMDNLEEVADNLVIYAEEIIKWTEKNI